MANFNPADFDNAVNPYTLSADEQKEIMNTVSDDRLTNPPGDYFHLKLDDKTVDIPKLEYISKKTVDGKIARIPTVDYIHQILDYQTERVG